MDIDKNILDASVWGPHYWFVLHTIALSYPKHPTKHNKKVIYDFFTNLFYFLPNDPMGSHYISLLKQFPIEPYLDSRINLMKWVHFIHNKINTLTKKPHVSFEDSIQYYMDNYKPEPIVNKEYFRMKKQYVYIGIMTFILAIIFRNGNFF